MAMDIIGAVDIIMTFVAFASLLIPLIPMHILSRKISSKTSLKPKHPALMAGGVAMFFGGMCIYQCIAFAFPYLPLSEELMTYVVYFMPAFYYVFIVAMILIYISLKDMESILFPGARKKMLLKAILALTAVFVPYNLLLFHPNIFPDALLSMILIQLLLVLPWTTVLFILSIDCFEVVDIFRKLGIKSWFYGLVGAIMFFAMLFSYFYSALVGIIIAVYPDSTSQVLQILTITDYFCCAIALIGSLLFLIPGIELHRKAELPVHGEGEENTAIREFLNNLGGIVGGSAAISILEGAVSGFRERRKEEISLQKDLTVKFDGNWEDFFEFLLSIAYQCVGPITFECSKNIGALEKARANVMEVFG